MKRRDTLITLLKQKGIPTLSEDIVWRRCRYCGQLFKEAKPYDVFCSWDCHEQHKAAQEPEQIEQHEDKRNLPKRC